MHKRIPQLLYWIGVISLAVFVALILITVIGGFFQAYRGLPDGLISFWDGLFGIFATIIAIMLTTSVNSYFKNREKRKERNENLILQQQKSHCDALQNLMNLVYCAENIDNMILEYKQRERETWFLEWRELWKDIQPLISNLHLIQDEKCRDGLDSAFGMIHKYVNDSFGSLEDVQSAFDFVVKNCEGFKEIIIDERE